MLALWIQQGALVLSNDRTSMLLCEECPCEPRVFEGCFCPREGETMPNSWTVMTTIPDGDCNECDEFNLSGRFQRDGDCFYTESGDPVCPEGFSIAPSSIQFIGDLRVIVQFVTRGDQIAATYRVTYPEGEPCVKNHTLTLVSGNSECNWPNQITISPDT